MIEANTIAYVVKIPISYNQIIVFGAVPYTMGAKMHTTIPELYAYLKQFSLRLGSELVVKPLIY